MINDRYLAEILRSNQHNIAVYIHLPWCVKKCPYCDFNSHQISANSNLDAYTSAIIDDIQKTELNGYLNISSIFFGGGTPSLFEANNLSKIIQSLETKFGFNKDIEITLEANPNSSDYSKFADYHAIGINRLSIGAQSFDNKHLKNLGRAHNTEEIKQAFKAARLAGFNNINIDIMHGLPNQSFAEASSDLRKAIALEPEHLSWYQLTIEPNTAFSAKPPILPEDDIRADIQDFGHGLLKEHGFIHIEISAFCRPNKHSQHNLHIWGFNDYIGFGAGAHSKIRLNGQEYRQYRHYHPKQYISSPDKVAHNKLIPESELLLEYLLNRARIIMPICKKHLSQSTKKSEFELSGIFSDHIKNGLLSETSDSWQLTKLGLDHLNTFLSDL